MAGKQVDVTLRLIDKMTSPLNTAGKALSQRANEFKRAGKDIQKAGKNISSIGSTLIKGVTVPVATAGAACINLAGDFEQGISKVRATMGKLDTGNDVMEEVTKTAGDMGLKVDKSLSKSEQQMDLLSQMAKKMGAETKFSATEATDAFNYMAMAGWKTNDMLQGIKPVMELAGASGEDLAKTSDILTDSLTAFGKTAADTEHFANVMAAASSNANTNVAMLGESFKYCAPVAGSMGYSIDDTSVALGLMANSGIKASNAGTALRSLLTNMANPTDTMATAMKTLGVSLDDGKGNMKSLSQVMNDLRSGFGNLQMPQKEYTKQLNALNSKLGNGEISTKKYNKEAEKLVKRAYGAEGALKAQAAAQLAGKTGMAGLLAVVNSSDKDFKKLTDAVKDSDDACHNMYETANDNLNGQLTILKSTLESIAISFGEKLTPYVKKATDYVQKMADKFNSLSDEQQNVIIKIALITASVGPAIFAFGKVVTTVGKVVSVFGQIGTAFKTFGSLAGIITSPAGIVIAVVAGIAAAAFLVWKNWDKIQPKIKTVIDAIKKTFEKIKPTLSSMLKTVQKAMPSIQKAINKTFKAIQPYITMAVKLLKKVATVISNVVTKAIESAKPLIQKFGDAFNAVFPVIADVVKSEIDKVTEIISNLQPVFKVAFSIIGEVLSGFGDTVSGIFDGVCKILGGVLDFITGVFTGNWKKAWEGVKSIFSGIFSSFTSLAKAPINGVIDIINGAIKGMNKVKVPDWVPGAGGKGIDIPLIPRLAKGTDNWKGGIVQISERGGEIVDLPQGSRVYPHDKSVQKAYQDGANAKSRGNIVINIPKLADSLIVREDADIDRIVKELVRKLEKTSLNIGGEEIGYLY